MNARNQRPGGREQGNASVDFILVFPVLLMIFFGIIQGSMWYQAQNVAHAAASAAYNSARVDNGTPGSGQAAGYQVISNQGSTLGGASVTVSRVVNQVSVTVTGKAPTLVPGWGGPEVTQTVSGPTERWVNR
jgi:Flp pilus assembly protein TadG